MKKAAEKRLFSVFYNPTSEDVIFEDAQRAGAEDNFVGRLPEVGGDFFDREYFLVVRNAKVRVGHLQLLGTFFHEQVNSRCRNGTSLTSTELHRIRTNLIVDLNGIGRQLEADQDGGGE